MVQEILTYTIVALALIVAFRKSVKRFSRKKTTSANEVLQKKSTKEQHKCADCIAECVLRDTVSPSSEDASTLCKRINISSD